MFFKRYNLGKPFRILSLLLFLPFLAPGAFAQEGPEHHAQSDAYWAEQAKAYPAFVVDPSQLRVAAANELNALGEWGPVLDWPHIPVSAAHLPDGRILTWASNDEEGFPGGQPEFTYAAAWDPATEDFKLVPHNTHDMFCAHQVMLEDGDVLVMGGRNTVRLVSRYDYETDTWIPQEQMDDPRWYPTSLALPNGEVMIAIGSGGSANPEMWNELTGWRKLTGVSLQTELDYDAYYENEWWPLFHVAPNGQVFHSGPTPDMHYIDTAGNGSISQVGPQITDWYPKHGTTVMYEEGKILTAGGAIAGDNTASTNRAMVIDITGGTPVVREIASMAHARKFQNGVPLPTGEVLVIGGNTSGIKFNDSGTVLAAEIFDPVTETWTETADMAIPRNYHSVALLMTDGRVWTGGGGLCGVGCAANHIDAQIYSPPYLFNDDGSLATRPVISSAPGVTGNGQNIEVAATAGRTRFSAIKMSSTTHGVDSDVRQISLAFTETTAGIYDVAMHANENVMTPGYWMLFGVNADGVPSEAAVIQISTEGVPNLANPGTQISTEGTLVSLQIVASDSDNGSLSYTATGLPTGLSIDGGSGLISGTIANGAEGTYTVALTVSDGLNTVDAEFIWEVIPEGAGIVSEYYEGSWSLLPDFDTLVPINTEVINNFDISNRDTEDFFGFRFTGYVNIETAGDYTFYTTSDDGSQLFINDNMVVDNDGLHAAAEQSGVVNLDEGYHAIEVTFFEHGGAASLVVQYEGPGIDKQTIPESRLFVAPPAPNTAPVVDAITDQNSYTGEVVSLQVAASDPEGDLISFSAEGLPAGLTINGDGLISGTIEASSAAENVVDVTVTDGSLDASASFSWDVWTPAEAQGEIGMVTAEQTGSSQWHTVTLDNSYTNPVVVMGPPSYNGDNKLTMRVRNVTENSFEFQFDEWDYLDGVHGSETVAYMVLEAGSHAMSDGRSIQAGFTTISGNAFNSVSFKDAFSSNPVVLTQVGSANDAAAVTSRNTSVSATGFSVQLEEQEGSTNEHGAETVYWVAIATGSDAAAIPNEAGITGNDVTDAWHTITFAQSYATNPVFFGDFQTVDGGDPATMRYQSLGSGSVEIFAEEEQAANDEVGHTTEVAGFVVFDEAGPIPFDGFALPPIVLTNPGDQTGAEGEAVSLAIQVEQDNGDPLTFSASGLPDGVSISTEGLISGGLVAGSAGSATVTVDVTDGGSNGSVTFNWNIDAARGTWIDYTDDSGTLSIVGDEEEKDIAVGDLDKDGWDDIIVVRKEGFMGTGARTDLLIMNESGTLVDRTADLAPGFAAEPTIARDAIITDLDGDGWDDVLIANTF
ncbi:MAG: putative Ig domain-containing protein, partial [Bacteroidota bacterium]